MIKILLLKNDLVLITELEEVGSELGEPDCKLVNPLEMNFNPDGDPVFSSWPSFTDQKELMISSGEILTIVEPNSYQLKKYQELTA